MREQQRIDQFDGSLQVRVPKAFIKELDEAARRRMVNRADFIRMTLRERLKLDGNEAESATVSQ
jgi:metal-responsive CopG/Arc/MetJ family transcriptional regulator